MSQGNTASAPYTIKNGVNPVVRFDVVRSPLEYGVKLLYPVRVRFLEGSH